MADLNTSVRIQLLDAFSAPLRKFGLELKESGKEAKKLSESFNFAANLNQASEAMGRFASMTRGLVERPANEFIEFEHQMSKVGAVGDLTTEQLSALTVQAKELGAATRFSATEAAQAQENLVSAGMQVNDILKATPTVLELATAGDLSLARASDILTGALSSFNFEAEKSGHVADVLATGAAVSKANVEFLSEVIAKAGPVAKQLGISLENVSAAGAAFADANIEAAVGGTALRTILLRLSAPAKQAEKAFQSLRLGGQQWKNLQKELGSGNLPGVLATIGKSFDKLGLTATQRVAKLKAIFGDEAAAQASVLIEAALKTDEKGLVQMRDAFANADGAAKKMAERMDNDTAGAMVKLASAWSGFLIDTGEKLAPTLVKLSDSAQQSLGALAQWVNENPELVSQLGHLAMVTATGALGMKALLVVMSASVSTFAVVKKAYVGMRAAALFLTPSIVQAKFAALAASPAFKALSGSMLGKVGLVGAAAAAGVGLGLLIRKIWDTDTAISNFIAKLTGQDINHESVGGRAAQRGLPAGGDQMYSDGTILAADGTVKKLGKGGSAAPKVVRDAQAAGHTTVESINKFIAERRANPSDGAAGVAAAPTNAGSDKVVAAIHENTRAVQRQERANRELLEEQRRNRRLRSGGPTTAGTGVF